MKQYSFGSDEKQESLETLSGQKHFKIHETKEFEIVKAIVMKNPKFGGKYCLHLKDLDTDEKFKYFPKPQYDDPKLEEAFGKSESWVGKSIAFKCVAGKKPYLIMGIPVQTIDIDEKVPF